MSDTSKEFDDVDITEAEGPDIEMGSDLQTQLGTPQQGDETEAAKAHMADQVRSVRSAEEGKREEPDHD